MLTSFSGFGAYAVGDTLGAAQSVEATRVREIEAYREVNSQTFLMSDGKYQCVVYAEDKFYENSDGKLVEIENAITTAKHTRGDVSYAYKNKSGKSNVYFANTSGNIFISAEKGTLSFAPKAARSTAKTVLGTEYEQMFASRSHGGYDDDGSSGTYICLSETGSEKLHSDDLTSAYDLSNMKIVMYIGCYTAYHYVLGLNNLPKATVARGAESAIGFQWSITCSDANDWLFYAVELLLAGKNVGYIVQDLNEDLPVNAAFEGEETTTIN